MPELRAPVRQVVIERLSDYLYAVYGVNRRGREITPRVRAQGRTQAGLEAHRLSITLGDAPVMWREPVEVNEMIGMISGCAPCSSALEPVQGADGRIYRNACWAQLAGNTMWGEVAAYVYNSLMGPEPKCIDPVVEPIFNPGMVREPAGPGWPAHPPRMEGSMHAGPSHHGQSFSARGGTDRPLVKPDPVAEAKEWAKSVQSPQKAAWAEHARRLGLAQPDIDRGWAALGFAEAVGMLKEVLGEDFTQSAAGAANVSTLGHSIPHIGMVRMKGTLGASFPFHTAAAERVWAKVQDLLGTPEIEGLSDDQFLGRAIEEADLPGYELTPEDIRLLEMAINWARVGKIVRPTPPDAPNRMGGMPGGPFRSNQYGHYLAGKGAP